MSIDASRSELKRYLPCLFEKSDIVEVRRLLPATGARRQRRADSYWCEAGWLFDAVPLLLDHNGDGHDIYVGANPRKAEGGTKAKDVALARCIFCDWDDGIGVAEARQRYLCAGLPTPTITINSGHGVHAYWRLLEPLADLDHWQRLQGALIEVVDSDPKPKDPPRIMRLPGFDNCKFEARVPCRVVDADPKRRYSLASLVGALGVEQQGHFTEQYEQTEQSESYRAIRANACNQSKTKAINAASLANSASKVPVQMSKAVELAIRESLPTGSGQRHDRLFVLARKLKAIHELASAEAEDLEWVLREWYEQAKSVIATQDFYTSLSEFITAWEHVKFPDGVGPIAVVRAEAEREAVPDCALRFDDARLRLLVGICRALQRYAGDGPFYLGCRTASEQLGISHTQAAIWLRLLCQTKILALVEKGTQRTNGSPNRAARYHYLHNL